MVIEGLVAAWLTCCRKQEAYEKNVQQLFKSLDRAEEHLKTQKAFYFGEKVTEADVRLYTTIVRFDVRLSKQNYPMMMKSTPPFAKSMTICFRRHANLLLLRNSLSTCSTSSATSRTFGAASQRFIAG